METPPSTDPAPGARAVTELLGALERGERGAADALLPLVYGELRAVAGGLFRGRPAGHTLQPTAVVHEAYLKIVGDSEGDWRGREHFLAVAARAMRQVLIDHARGRGAAKRGGEWRRVSLDGDSAQLGALDASLIELDDALARLEELSERQARVVELRYFAGLSVPEAARVLGVSPRTVDTEWHIARAWLRAELTSVS